MTNAELLKKIKRHRGRITVTVEGGCDSYYVAVIKADLIKQIEDLDQAANADLELTSYGQTVSGNVRLSELGYLSAY